MINWNEWIKEHIEKCEICDLAFNHLDEANSGMCEEAFKMMQQAMKNNQKEE